MKKIPLTKGQFAIVDDDDYIELIKYKWFCRTDGYAGRHIYPNGKDYTLLMHRAILKMFHRGRKIQVDHINGNKLDNRKENLRLATNTQNGQNRRITKSNTSGYKGVNWHKNRWVARITINKKRIHIGYFDNKIDAAKAYDKEVIKHFGEFGVLNFPNNK